MKYVVITLILFAIAPLSFAQQKYKEAIFIFTIDFDSGVDASDECEPALTELARLYNIEGINPSFGSKFNIRAVETSAKNGRVTADAGDEIGQIFICHDLQTYPAEQNFIPVYYEISIGKRTYKIAGGGTSVDFPDLPNLPGGRSTFTPPGFPTPERLVFQISGTVLPSIPGRKGGTYMESVSTGGSGNVDDGLTNNTIHILRAMLPVDE